MMTEWKKYEAPISAKIIKSFRSGDGILLDGVIYTARDKAHQRLCRLIENKEELPFNPENQLIYYVGPTPGREGVGIGSAGPTTSYRMDPFSETILKTGIKGMIGKGKRDKKTRDLLKKHKAVYFSTFGGAGAYLGKRIIKASVIAFEDLGAEAVFRLEVKDFPLIVVNDIYGGDLYEDAVRNRN